jgi:L-ascorbate metabolism protein UlaG (beta-lactamase superfamily)
MAAGAARIVYVGHATVLVELDGVRLLTDPLLRPRLLHLRRQGRVDLEALRSVDAVLISHAHFDHLDLSSLRMLGREVQIVAPRGAGSLLRKRGFGKVTEVEAGDGYPVGSLTVTATLAVHASTRRPFGLRANPVGYVLAGSRSVYFAGDTDVFEDMAGLGPVDLALVPIWGWGPSLGPGHMSPQEAAEAVRLLRASLAVPIHWGTFFPVQSGLRGLPGFLDRPAEEFKARVGELAPDTEVRILSPGAETTF